MLDDSQAVALFRILITIGWAWLGGIVLWWVIEKLIAAGVRRGINDARRKQP